MMRVGLDRFVGGSEAVVGVVVVSCCKDYWSSMILNVDGGML